MEYSAARYLQAYLIAQGVGADPDVAPIGAWPIYLDGMPDGDGIANDLITLFDTSGQKQGRYMNGGQSIIFPGIMVQTRAVLRDDAFSKIYEIGIKLDQLLRASITITTPTPATKVIQAVSRKGSILSLGVMPGDVRRVGFSLNAIVSYA